MDLLFYPPLGADHNGAPEMRSRPPAERDSTAVGIDMEGGGEVRNRRETPLDTHSKGLGTAPRPRHRSVRSREEKEEDLRHLLRLITVVFCIVLFFFGLLVYARPGGSIWNPEPEDA